MSIEEAKQFLRSAPKDGSASLYDHLSRVLLKVIIERPQDAAEVFEEISATVRTESTKGPPPPPPAAADDAAAEEKDASTSGRQAQLDWTVSQTPMFAPETAEDLPEDLVFQDLLEEARMWECAGVSLSPEETYRLGLSIKALAVANNASTSFWGKLVTRSGDYYVAQAVRDPEELGEVDKEVMEGTDGPNKYVYFVSKAPTGAKMWTKLPPVTPMQCVVGRQIKRFLSGDLAAPVHSFPPFPGDTEANLVATLVALITADCHLSLNGLLKPSDEAEDEQRLIAANDPEEQPEAITLAELEDMGTWVHSEVDICPNGRCQLVPVKEDENGDPIEPEDPQPELKEVLRSIGEDLVSEESGKVQWVLRAAPGGAGKLGSSCVVARSLQWPGFSSVAKNKTVTNIYAGTGIATSQTVTYTPPMPKPTQKEFGFPTEENEEGEQLVEQPDVVTEPPKEEEDE